MWLRIAGPEPSRVELDVHGDPAGRTLVDALVDGGSVPGAYRGQLRIVRTGEPVDVDRPLSALGLRNGDVLDRFARRPSAARDTVPELAVVLGPSAGLTRRLDADVVVGRAAQLTLDDPGLSREHVRFSVDGTTVLAQDLGSLNKTYLFGRPLETPVPVPPGAPVEAASSILRVLTGPDDPLPASPVRDGLAQFNRPPRVARPQPGRHHVLPAPPDPRPPRRIPLASALAPLVIAPVLLATGGGNIAFLAMLVMSPVVAMASWWEDRRHGGKDYRDEEARFRSALEQARTALERDLPQETITRWAAAPDLAELLRRTHGPASDLWERRPGDPDYLDVRVGWSDLPSAATFEVAAGGQEELRAEAAATLTPYLTVRCAPVVINLADVGALGLAGPTEQTGALARWLCLQLAVLHSPRDLRLAAALADGSDWPWFGVLPHAAGADGPALATSPDSARRVLAELTALVEERAQEATGRMNGRPTIAPTVVLFVDETLGLSRQAVGPLLEQGPAVGVHVVWLATHRASVPGECRALVSLTAPTVAVTWTDSGRVVDRATLDVAPVAPIEAAAWNLAGLADASTRQQGGEVPATAPYATVLGMTEPTVDEIVRRWRSAKGLAAPLGLGPAGRVDVELRHDGPHALVGGTTGAGKSELLQTLVASLAAHNPPERLTFLLVDYKGGAAFKDCVSLPHTVGFVTDLDRHLVHRVLISLAAELEHRERTLAAAGARDLVEMERLSPETAPPALAIVVDEFAALATELPEFVDGVVNLAQRGRSLGMHLVLATQRPAGVINDQIRANTNLRISLRMNDTADSDDVIGTPVAAKLPRSLPGRCYVRTGSAELTALQTAFGGGHSFGDGRDRPRVGLRTAGAAPRGGPAMDDEGPTDLQRLVEVVTAAHRATDRPAPRLPWLPSLPELLPADALPAGTGTVVAVGLRDEPHRQRQTPHVIDLAERGSLLIAGSSGAGKTTLLRTLATRLAEQNSPADLQLYALDFASRGLGPLAGLPHCGGVVSGDDAELALRLLNTVNRWLAQRRKLVSEAAVSSLEELRRIELQEGRPATPRVVVLLDGYGAFAQAFEKVEYGSWLERLPLLVSEGRALGIHWVLTADRRLAMSTALLSALPERVVLRLNESDEYDLFGLDRKRTARATLPAGRGFSGTSDEVQIAVIGDRAEGQAQMTAVGAVARKLRADLPDAHVPTIQLLPAVVPAHTLPAHVGQAAVLGIEDAELAPVTVDPANGAFLVAGPPRSGKSTALLTLTRSLRAAQPDAAFVLVAPRRTPLTSLDLWGERFGADDEEGIDDLLDRVTDRTPADPPLFVVVDDMQELVDERLDGVLENIARRGRDKGVHVLCACDRSVAHRAYGGLVHRVRADRFGLLLQVDPDADGDLLGATLERRWAGGPPGRGALVVGGTAVRIQVAGREAS